MDYYAQLTQSVDFPRCRIYRDFIRNLMGDTDIRLNGSSYLFYFVVLCSYANYNTSYRTIEVIRYYAGPGEWFCTAGEISEWFRTRFHHQAISILDYLEEQNYITYTRLGRGNLIKYRITDWEKFNKSINGNFPCAKTKGFFFFPIATAHELISLGKCSERDIVLDLWIHTIYNDVHVQGSYLGPVVYFRDLTGNPIISFFELGKRWRMSKATACRVMKKLQEKGYLSLTTFTGNNGSIIYLCNYLSTMFDISDVLIDKEEVSMTFNIPIHIPDNTQLEDDTVSDTQISIQKDEETVSKDGFLVSESHIRFIVKQLAKVLAKQGIPCCECPSCEYILYSLSDCKDVTGVDAFYNLIGHLHIKPIPEGLLIKGITFFNSSSFMVCPFEKQKPYLNGAI